MEPAYKTQVIKAIAMLSNSEIEAQGENLFKLVNDATKIRPYFIELFEVDGAGTLGIKIKWLVGFVVDQNKLLGNLKMNFECGVNSGPLFTSILPNKDGADYFALVGQLIFPPNTPAEEVATIFFHNVFFNYALFEFVFPGVEILA